MHMSSRRLWLPATTAILALALPALAQTFTYTENFNSVDPGTKPPGWNTFTTVANNPALDPVVLDADPAGWATPLNYGVDWSGGKRFNFIHPAQDAGGRGAVAWYSGQGGSHTGTYPMDLQTNRMKVEFDLSIRTGTISPPADGGVFAVQPVADAADVANAITRIGAGGGGMGWGGLTGFAVEFDIWDNGAANDPAGPDATNHIGLDVYLRWAGGDQVPSLRTHLDPPLSLEPGALPRFVDVGNNNQPMHFTIYYSDPNEGGPGVVRVYMKVDPATKDPAEPFGSAISFGMETGHPDGALVLEACVGPWPTPGAIFGFTGSTGGNNSVYQIDNIKAETNTTTGESCVPPELASFLPGPDVTLDTAGKVADCAAANLTEQGWDVSTYVAPGLGNLAQFKQIATYQELNGNRWASAHAVPDINFNSSDCGGGFLPDRPFPGMPIGWDVNNFGIVAKGWICFPPDDPANPNDNYPRSYPLNVRSDDDFELIMGTGTTNQVISTFTGGRGCGTASTTEVPGVAGTSFNLVVPAPGVYAVQLLWCEYGGGAGVEFSRRFQLDNLLLKGNDVLVGPAVGSLPDQPVVYSLKNGQPAPDLLSTYTPAPPPGEVVLSPSNKVEGTLAGQQGLNAKIVQGPPGLNVYHARDDDDRQNGALRWLDLFDGVGTGVVNKMDISGNGDGSIGGGVKPPNYLALRTCPNNDCNLNDREQYAIRLEGFIFLPKGQYLFETNHDDDIWVKIGGQTVFARVGCCVQRIWPLTVVEEGVYPIRLEGIEGGGGDHWELGHINPITGTMAAVGDVANGDNLQIATEVSSGPYVWETQGTVIPADRKVADVGQGQDLGWNATLTSSPFGVEIARTGQGTLLHENAIVGVPDGSAPFATDTPNDVNYVDIGEGGGNFGGDRDTSFFLKPDSTPIFTAGGNNGFNITVTGYVEFPAAGNYGINLNGDDGGILWIGGKVVTVFPFPTGPTDQTVGEVYISEPGIYDIRADLFEDGGGYSFELFQYTPDGNRALVNSDQATFKVYRTLAAAPTSTKYANPVRLPASAKAGTRGSDPGFTVNVIKATFVPGAGGNGNDPEQGRATLRTLSQATEMIDHVLGIKPSLDQLGVQKEGSPGVVATLEGCSGYLGYDCGDPGTDDFAVRVSGYLDLKAGGHLFEIASDDGFDFWIGAPDPRQGWNVGQSGALKGASTVQFYVWVPEDGLYPFMFDQFERGGGAGLTFSEVVYNNGAFVTEPVNGGSGLSARAYTKLDTCPRPFADADRDGDVDQEDFGVFQACYTGEATGVTSACKCFDRDSGGLGNGDVSAQDLVEFVNCLTGPAIPWSQELAPSCNP